MFSPRRAFLAAALAAALLPGCATSRARAVVAVGGPDFSPADRRAQRTPSSFITTFWCGPPFALFDDATAAEIAAAGFTIVGPPCEDGAPFEPEAAKAALDVAARHAIRIWIQDPRFSARGREQPGWEAAIAAAVADYSHHPAFGGYFIVDEPVVKQFDDLAAVVERLRALDPDHVAYINLLPDYAIRGAGATSYFEYVDRFLTAVRPRLLSYDYYPFLTTGDRRTFFSSLALMRDEALKYDLPFMLIVLAMPHGNYRDPTEAELSWQVMHALAFGARGVSYFAYWTPVNVMYQDVMKFRRGLIEQGKPTRHYTEAARLNPRLRAIADELSTFRSVVIAESRDKATTSLPTGPVVAIESGPVTAGIFDDEAGRWAMLLVNRDYRFKTSVRLRIRDGLGAPQRFDADTGAWRDDANLSVGLGAGQALLLRWNRHVSSPAPN